MLADPAVCNCYCRGSDDEERRFRWRYTSVPYLSVVSQACMFFALVNEMLRLTPPC